jgi:hypothetical protein
MRRPARRRRRAFRAQAGPRSHCLWLPESVARPDLQLPRGLLGSAGRRSAVHAGLLGRLRECGPAASAEGGREFCSPGLRLGGPDMMVGFQAAGAGRLPSTGGELGPAAVRGGPGRRRGPRGPAGRRPHAPAARGRGPCGCRRHRAAGCRRSMSTAAGGRGRGGPLPLHTHIRSRGQPKHNLFGYELRPVERPGCPHIYLAEGVALVA